MLCRDLAIELAPLGITINNIAPGAIETPINTKLLNDPALMNLALSHIESLAAHYAAAGEAVALDLTALGPGYRMLRADTSPVRARIAEIGARHPFVVFSACQAARAALARAAGREPAAIPQVPEARDVPAGIVHLAELQERGWSYLRP